MLYLPLSMASRQELGHGLETKGRTLQTPEITMGTGIVPVFPQYLLSQNKQTKNNKTKQKPTTAKQQGAIRSP